MVDLESLPIDIHSSKLLDWLQSRRHCSKEWQKAVYSVREKISDALKDMPEHPDIVKLLAGTFINYFHCLQIVEILKETEAETKNFFGRYSSQRMKDWQDILYLYQKDNLYLAEAAQILQRFVAYEIPGIKKQIAKGHANKEEAEKKEVEYRKSSKEAERQFDSECRKMNIKGASIRSELADLSASLPDFLSSVQERAKDLDEALSHYSHFRKFILSRPDIEANLLPNLRYVMTKGNTTYYEWKTGEAPSMIEPFKLQGELGYDAGNDDEIDFGDQIDFDGQIDFGGGDVTVEDDSGLANDVSGISLDESGIAILEDAVGDETELQPQSCDGVARGADALSVLEHSETQRLFLLDVMELEVFLKGRLYCLQNVHPADFLTSQAMGSDRCLDKSETEVQKMLLRVQDIVREMNDPYKRHLFKIRSSKRYLDQLTDQLSQKKSQIQKYVRLAELMDEKQIEAEQEVADLQPRLELVIAKTRELQKQIEDDISKRYKNRPVNIMGGITAALSASS